MAKLPGYQLTVSFSTKGVLDAVKDLDRRLADVKTELTEEQRRIIMTWLGTLIKVEIDGS